MTPPMPDAPTTALMKQRWAALAAAIATQAAAGGEPAGAHARGSLTVLGSGIAHADLSIEVEQQVRQADDVFFNVNDHVTRHWIGALRPDAYDLSVLYDEAIERHATYTRMAEAMLHPVRQGRRVVAIFYGHPGVFAAPGHRAVQVARKEGHRARMRPGISALDCLVADIGFDPALPGMVTYEATDMLLRRRRLDPTLHTVIWQVGVVGEFGYRPGGYGNRGLEALTDALEAAYGPDWTVVHYVGAQYAGLEPRIEPLPVAALRDPRTARDLSTLSTFYIAPKDVADTDPEMAAILGARVPARSEGDGIDYTSYGPRERMTLCAMADLRFSASYRVVPPNAALAFVSAMSRDVALCQRFERDAAAVLEGPEGSALTDWEKSLLLTRHPKAMAAALTGVAAPANRLQAAE